MGAGVNDLAAREMISRGGRRLGAGEGAPEVERLKTRHSNSKQGYPESSETACTDLEAPQAGKGHSWLKDSGMQRPVSERHQNRTLQKL